MKTKPSFCTALIPLLWMVTTGCHTPNVKPFADATADLHSAVRQVYNTTWTQLDGFEAIDKDTGNKISRGSTNHFANRLTNGWAPRLQVMEAMVSYSESLVNIVNAGETSKANAKAISEQAAKLVEATPWGVYGDAAKSIFQQVHGLAVSVAQYRSISRAVEKADESVQRCAEAIGRDVESLGRMLGPLHEDQEAGIIRKFNNHRAYVNAVTDSKKEFENKLLQLRGVEDGGRLALLNARHALVTAIAERASGDTLGDLTNKLQAATAKFDQAEKNVKLISEAVSEYDRLLARVADQEKEFQTAIAANQELRRNSLALVTSTREAIRLWATVHKDLKTAIAEQREPNVRLLVSSALQIRETIQKLKNP